MPFVRWRIIKLSNQILQIQSDDENFDLMRDEPHYLEPYLAKI